MSQQSSIEWTDATWNPVRGCVKVSPGCANCYAETFAERFRGVKGHPYEQGFDLHLVPEKLAEPLSWKKPRRVFVNSMSDLFQDGVPDSYIDQVFAVMALCPQHTFQVLTKRAERMLAYVTRLAKSIAPLEAAAREIGHTFNFNGISLLAWPVRNVWLGVSVENQHFADERIPLLLQTPAAVRFISAEPLLGRVSFWWAKWDNQAPNGRRLDTSRPSVLRDGRILAGSVNHLDGLRMLDWVIVGGESGHGARPCALEWIAAIRRQCQEAGVACFVKQLGTNVVSTERVDDVGQWAWRAGLQSRKGGDMAEWPADLQVREFPLVGAAR